MIHVPQSLQAPSLQFRYQSVLIGCCWRGRCWFSGCWFSDCWFSGCCFSGCCFSGCWRFSSIAHRVLTISSKQKAHSRPTPPVARSTSQLFQQLVLPKRIIRHRRHCGSFVAAGSTQTGISICLTVFDHSQRGQGRGRDSIGKWVHFFLLKMFAPVWKYLSNHEARFVDHETHFGSETNNPVMRLARKKQHQTNQAVASIDCRI